MRVHAREAISRPRQFSRWATLAKYNYGRPNERSRMRARERERERDAFDFGRSVFYTVAGTPYIRVWTFSRPAFFFTLNYTDVYLKMLSFVKLYYVQLIYKDFFFCKSSNYKYFLYRGKSALPIVKSVYSRVMRKCSL